MGPRQPMVRLQIVGVEGDGLAVGRGRFFAHAGRAERIAEIGMRVGVVGAERNGPLQRAAGLGAMAGFEEEDSEAVVRFRIGRRRLGRPAQQHRRLVEAAATVAGDAGKVQDTGIRRTLPRQQLGEELVGPLRTAFLHMARRAGEDIPMRDTLGARRGASGAGRRLPSSRSPVHRARRRVRAMGRLTARVAVLRPLPLPSRVALSGPSGRR